ncbi:MAG: dUTP diphosphatase [Candidatus Poribacteria bacterium]|nr:dUTP diphosphatase [Candidatus Poribacteria bacterium]MDE0503834.1 dUTP diphosphatase [Candidatus Poribacteria bacterium]
MNVKITRVDKDLPLPKYETEGSVGFDFLCRESVKINPHSLALIPANVIVQTPPGYMLMVTLRSSTPRKRSLLIPHGVGVIDQDYCGDEDEIKIQAYNFSSDPVVVERGDRIAQGIFVRVDVARWSEVDRIESETRGGFGSTGNEGDFR